jgi:predicted secreted protein
MLRLLCYLGLHRRSKSRAQYDGEDYVSVCRRCRARMRKEPSGRWTLAED